MDASTVFDAGLAHRAKQGYLNDSLLFLNGGASRAEAIQYALLVEKEVEALPADHPHYSQMITHRDGIQK